MGPEWGTNWWKGDSSSSVQDVSSLTGREDVLVRIVFLCTLFHLTFIRVLTLLHLCLTLLLQDIHDSSGGHSGVFAVVSWHDSVQGLAVSRRDEMLSSEVWTNT